MGRYSIILLYGIFLTALKILCDPHIHPLSPPKLLVLTNLLIIFFVLTFLECHTVGITQYVTSSDWLLALRNMHLRFILAFLWLDSSLLSKSPLSGWTPVYFLIHPLKDIFTAS